MPTNKFVFDIETNGKEPWDGGKVLSVAWSQGDEHVEAAYCQVDGAEQLPLAVVQALADPSVAVVCHTKYDIRYLKLLGYEVSGPVWDTQVMAWVMNENTPLDLEYLADRYCGLKMDKRIKRVNGVPHFTCDDGRMVTMEEAPADQLCKYNAEDVSGTVALFDTLHRLMDESMWLDYWLEEEVPFTSVLLGMETAGLPYDEKANAKLHVELEQMLEEQARKLNSLMGYEINWGSPNQLREVLFSKLWYQHDSIKHGLDLRKPTLVNHIAKVVPGAGLERPLNSVTDEEVAELRNRLVEVNTPNGFKVQKVTNTQLHGYWTRKGLGLKKTPPSEKTKQPTTSTPDLLYIHADNEFIQELVRWRKIRKVMTTYTGKFPEKGYGGRIYGRFNQTGTKTGRLSSSGPNLQNIPAHGDLGEKVRSLFCGNLIIGDYSQLEPRLMAHYSQDPILLDTYRSNKDIYLVTAKGIFGREVEKHEDERQIAKTLILALGYGAGAAKLAQVLALNGYPTSVATAKGYLDELQALYSGLFEWKEGVVGYAKRKGYVTTIGGRHRRVGAAFKERWNHKNVGYGERQAVNAVIQGSAADIVRRTMVATANVPGLTLLAQVHDELIWEHRRLLEETYIDGYTLPTLKQFAENPGYKLDVPLVFEPSFCTSWADKGGKPVILDADAYQPTVKGDDDDDD